MTTAAFRRDSMRSCARHDLADGGGHLGRHTGSERGQHGRCHFVGQQPVAKAADSQGRDRRECLPVVRVDDQPRHLVDLVRHDLIGEEGRKWQVSKRKLGGDPLLAGLCRDPGEHIATAQGRCPGHKRLEIGKRIAAGSDRRTIIAAFPTAGRPAARP